MRRAPSFKRNLLQKKRPRIRHHHLPRRPLKKRQPQPRLHTLHLTRDRALRQPRRRRRLRKRTVSRHQLQQMQLVNIERNRREILMCFLHEWMRLMNFPKQTASCKLPAKQKYYG
jgi:hypothetical protein